MSGSFVRTAAVDASRSEGPLPAHLCHAPRRDRYLASEAGPNVPETNLLPAPEGKLFSLTFRTYIPKEVVKRGEWSMPAIQKLR